MRIEKKTSPEYFQQILAGRKNFEVRLADFECKPGDVLVLREWSPKTKQYTGRVLEKEVTYVFNAKEMEKFHSKEELAKHGLIVISLK